MSGPFVIATYKVKSGKEAEFETLLAEHARVLTEQGLTATPSYNFKASDNIYVEVMQWVSEEAASKAHSNSAVQEIWEKAAKLAEFIPIAAAKEAQKPFAHFAPIASPKRDIEMSEYMLSAKDYKSVSSFYQSVASFRMVEDNPSFVMLQDPHTRQNLCITNGESISKPGASFRTWDLPKTLDAITKASGKIVNTWEFQTMRGANCEDPEGNAVFVWSMKQ